MRPRSAHFDAVYAAAAWPDMAATEQMLTIDEPGGISGTSAWMPSIGPVTLMAKVCVPGLERDVRQPLARGDAGVVDQRVHLAVLGLDPGGQRRPSPPAMVTSR